MTKVRNFDLIDGFGHHLSRVRLGRNRTRVKEVPLQEKPSGGTLFVHLPHRVVSTCRPKSLSPAFSHAHDIEGKEVVIWCNGEDQVTITHAFMGIVEKVSTRSARKWALRIAEAFDVSSLTKRRLKST